MAGLSQKATGDFTATEMVRALCDASARALPVDGVGVMIRRDGRNEFVHTAGARAEDVVPLEQLQETLQQGPCADCVASGETVVSTNLPTDDRWEDFQSVAARVQLGAMVSVPLLARGQTWGVLDLYRRAPSVWTDQELEAARALADVTVSYLVMADDRDQAREAQQELARRALHDDLTGLPNRALLFDRLEHALASAARWPGAVAVVFLDLDLFKVVNDTFGHTTADSVLVEVAHRLSAALRVGDTLARFAGDEFVIVCEGLPEDAPDALAGRAEALTGRLQQTLRSPIRVGDVDVVVSASIGAAVSSGPTTAQELLAEADVAMYAAKQNGRGRVSIRDRNAPRVIGYTHQLERDLAGALDRGELRVHYQPIVHADTRRVAAVEALLRWDRSDNTVLPAAAFIDIAHRTGLIVTVGRWVIAQACRQLAAWQHTLGDRAPATVYVNLSSRELADGELLDTISAVLADTGLSPRNLALEIVEEDLSDPAIVSRLNQLQALGHCLCVDDFGTGYSSLSRLLDLPVDLAKIDKSFVAGLPDQDRWIRFVDGILYLADKLELGVIAEGVETSEQAEHLTRVGCQLLQGYHLARPQDAEQLTASWR